MRNGPVGGPGFEPPRQVKVESFAQRKQQRWPTAIADLDAVIQSEGPSDHPTLQSYQHSVIGSWVEWITKGRETFDRFAGSARFVVANSLVLLKWNQSTTMPVIELVKE